MKTAVLALLGAALCAAPVSADAQVASVQSADEALAQDAAQYALAQQVTQEEAVRRLRAQEESVAATERLQRLHRDRLAGLSIEHGLTYRVAVLLTGDVPVDTQWLFANGMAVPVVFRTGAAATRNAVIAALRRHQAEIGRRMPSSAGMGHDPRTGDLLIMADGFEGAEAREAREAELSALTGVPVRIRSVERPTDFALGGGARLYGEAGGRQQACTAGFVVAKGERTAVVTAAHCPDTLFHRDGDGAPQPLSFAGQWGVAYQDVQVNLSDRPLDALFYVDDRTARVPAATRARAGTRAGDYVCHRGAFSGYSCAEIELVDYAPAGALCAGPCEPLWTTVAGPQCRHGDSGGPVFLGGTAFGIVKGGSYRGGRCSFYFYMAIDYLPDGWSLLGPGSGADTGAEALPVATPAR